MSRKSLGVGLVWLCAGLAHAQSTTSTILGHVRAETQAALPGAEISARHVESGLVRTTTSDDDRPLHARRAARRDLRGARRLSTGSAPSSDPASGSWSASPWSST